VGVTIDPERIRGIGTTLDDAAEAIEALGASAPSSVDAGIMSGVVHGLLSKMTESTGNVSTALRAVADSVEGSRSRWWDADDHASTSLHPGATP
jgi:hypothetical protein